MTAGAEAKAREAAEAARAERAWRSLKAAGLGPLETDQLLAFLCGWAPDGVLHGLASCTRFRPGDAQPDPLPACGVLDPHPSHPFPGVDGAPSECGGMR